MPGMEVAAIARMEEEIDSDGIHWQAMFVLPQARANIFSPHRPISFVGNETMQNYRQQWVEMANAGWPQLVLFCRLLRQRAGQRNKQTSPAGHRPG